MPADDDGDGDGLSFFPVGPHVKQTRRQLSSNAELTWTVEARSWTEAMTLYHEHMGREPYRPVEDPVELLDVGDLLFGREREELRIEAFRRQLQRRCSPRLRWTRPA